MLVAGIAAHGMLLASVGVSKNAASTNGNGEYDTLSRTFSPSDDDDE